MNQAFKGHSQPFLKDKAVAWVVFDGRTGGTATIKSSYRIQSVVREGLGQYAITFEYEQPTEFYAFIGNCRTVTAVGFGFVTEQGNAPARTNKVLRVTTIGVLSTPSVAGYDSDLVTVMIFGQ